MVSSPPPRGFVQKAECKNPIKKREKRMRNARLPEFTGLGITTESDETERLDKTYLSKFTQHPLKESLIKITSAVLHTDQLATLNEMTQDTLT